MAKTEVNAYAPTKTKGKTRAVKKKTSNNKHSVKKYVKPYRGQGH